VREKQTQPQSEISRTTILSCKPRYLLCPFSSTFNHLASNAQKPTFDTSITLLKNWGHRHTAFMGLSKETFCLRTQKVA